MRLRPILRLGGTHIYTEREAHTEKALLELQKSSTKLSLFIGQANYFYEQAAKSLFFLSKISNDAKHWIILDLIQWPKSKVTLSIKFLTMCKFISGMFKTFFPLCKNKSISYLKKKKKNCIFFKQYATTCFSPYPQLGEVQFKPVLCIVSNKYFYFFLILEQ